MKTLAFPWTLALAAGALAVVACTPAPAPRGARYEPQTPPSPTPMPMEIGRAHGLWHSNFGAVKIEPDPSRGEGAVMGVWVYDRNGQEVIGFFSGTLEGNVMQFSWHEPNQPRDLVGGGFVAFDPQGDRFSGRWWTEDRSRGNAWYGWRETVAGSATGAPTPTDGTEYGGQGYGGQGYSN